MHLANSALRMISLGCAIIAAIAVGITAIAYVAEVVFRYGLNNPLNWSGDIGSYMLSACVFMAIPLISRRRGHIAVTVVLDLLPDATRLKVNRALDLVVAAVLLVVAYFVLQVCIRHFQQGVLTTMANQIPRWWLTGTMTFSLLLAALNFIFPADQMAHDVKEF